MRRAIASSLVLLFISCVLAGSALAQTLPLPPERVRVVEAGAEPVITTITLATTSPTQYRPVELRLALESGAALHYYPFSPVADGYGDPTGITVDATVTAPSGAVFTVPAFWYVPYRREAVGATGEAWGVAGHGAWTVRFLPRETGLYHVRVAVTDQGGTATSPEFQVVVSGSGGRGLVRVNAADPRFLTYENGDDFLPIGEGRQWTPDIKRLTLSYDEAFASDAANGVNLTRIWDQNDGYNLSIEGSDAVWEPRWSQFTQALGIELAQPYRGRRAARFASPTSAVTEGYYQRVAVLPNTSYTLTALVRTDAMSGTGAVISLGASSHLSPGPARSTARTGTGDWAPVSVTMTTGASERSLGVFVGGVAARGTAWFDAVTLVAAGSTVNVLSDPDFERHFPRADRGNDPEDPTVNRSVPKGTWINQWAAAKLDAILDAAATHGIAVQLCMHGDVYWTWDATIWGDNYATANGYKVSWLDERHVGYWKRNLRYRIARWGASPSLLAWELWNEHGNIPVSGTEPDVVVFQFYQQVVPFIAATDPFDHLITTSQGSQAYSPLFWTSLPFGLANYHDYITTALQRHPASWTNDATMFVYQNANDLVQRWPAGAARLPFIWGEIGTLTVWDVADPVATQGVGGANTRHAFVWAGAFSPVFAGPIDWYTVPKAASTRALRAFFEGERYSRSGWTTFATSDVGGSGITVSDARLRVLALRSADQGRLLAWLEHRDATWARIARDGISPTPFTGTFTGPSLVSGVYRIEWWDTRAGTVLSTSQVNHPGGAMTVSLAAPLSSDVAVKIEKL